MNSLLQCCLWCVPVILKLSVKHPGGCKKKKIKLKKKKIFFFFIFFFYDWLCECSSKHIASNELHASQNSISNLHYPLGTEQSHKSVEKKWFFTCCLKNESTKERKIFSMSGFQEIKTLKIRSAVWKAWLRKSKQNHCEQQTPLEPKGMLAQQYIQYLVNT